MTSPKTPAETLAAVLRVVAPETEHEKWYVVAPPTMDFGDVYRDDTRKAFHHALTVLDSFELDSKDDLSRVVAMLSPTQRTAFCDYLGEHLDAPDYVEAITAPASVWLAALAAATLGEAD